MNRAERRRLKRAGDNRAAPPREPANMPELMLADTVHRGMMAMKEDDLTTAEALFREVLEEDIEHPGGLHGMALIARSQEKWDVGAELMRRALLRDPNDALMYSTLGSILESAGRFEESVAAYKLGLRFLPRNTVLLNNLGSVMMRLGQRSQALTAFRKSIDLGETGPEVLTNYATALADIGQFERAEPFYNKMLELYPEPSSHHYLYGGQMLKNGLWRDGWTYYERRFLTEEFRARERNFRAPMWDGSDLEGRSLLLWGEQGIGDEIRYASMITDALAKGASITVECSPKLVALLERAFPGVEIMASPYTARPETADRKFDLMCPFGSLGRFFRANAEAFPRHEGYLVADPVRAASMAERLAGIGPGPYIGVCWRSGLSGTFRSDYYTTVRELGPLFQVEGATFINLQYDVTEEELEEARSRLGVTLHRWDDLDLYNDLDGAGALTKAMDLVVSAATSVSCMAGAMGVPTREFRPTPVPGRYLIDGSCPWFPSLRYADKRLGDPWSKIFRRVALELKNLVNKQK